jgi:gas vesicle protein
MHKKSSGVGTFLRGLIIGGLTGSAAILLAAPQSGKETRKQLQTKGAEIRNIAENTVDNVLDALMTPAEEPASRSKTSRSRSQTASASEETEMMQ